jgi:prepilin-type N-terminal cleavage/methylation domain-containing protein
MTRCRSAPLPDCRWPSQLLWQKSEGFSLLELSIVLTIIALITGSGLMMGSSMLESAKRASTNNKLDAIETALYAFRMTNNRLPCPADATIAAGGTNSGVEAANAGSCTGGTPAANRSVTVSGISGDVVEGTVPTRALNLPDEFMLDGWGRRITYAVWSSMTAADAFLTYGIRQNCGAITVKDAGAGNRTTAAAYALVSHGADGHGGYLPAGSRMNAGSTNGDEQTNCHCDAGAADAAYAASYVQKVATENSASATDKFDDVVRFKERWQLQSADDGFSPNGMSCLPGFRIDGAAAGNKLAGTGLYVMDISGDGKDDLMIGDNGASWMYALFGKTTGWSNPFVVSSIDGTNGFSVHGIHPDTRFCTAYSASGDLDNDGHPDLVMSYNVGWECAGIRHLMGIFGGQVSWMNPYTVDSGSTDFNGTTGFAFYTLGGAFDLRGSTVNGVGKINNDNYADILIGTTLIEGPPDYLNNGVLLGHARPWPAYFTIDDVDGTNSIRIRDDLVTQHYNTSATLGDVDGDGKKDIILNNDCNSAGCENATIIYGGAGPPWANTIYLTSNLNTGAGELTGFRIEKPNTSSTSYFAHSIMVGNFNGDAAEDIVIGDVRGEAGAAYTIFGSGSLSTLWASGWDPAANLTGGNGFSLYNDIMWPGYMWGSTVGDITGDGRDDIIWVTNNTLIAIYFSVGGGYPAATTIDNPTMNGTDALFLTGVQVPRIAIADINDDGVKDLILGDKTASPSGRAAAGATYVIFGTSPGSWSCTGSPCGLDVTTGLDGTNGLVIQGAVAGDQSGYYVAGADLNADGVKDIVTCAPTAGNNGAESGSCYVVYGRSNGVSWPATFDLQSLN